MNKTPEVKMRSEVRDGMRIMWHVPIEMDDGIVLRADVYRPIEDGRYPVILTYGVYAKGLSYQEGYPHAVGEDGRRPSGDSPGLDQQVPELGGHRPRAVGPARVRRDARGLPGRRLVPGLHGLQFARGRSTTSTSASNGRGRSRGATARSACWGSPTTPATSGAWRESTRRT